MAVIGRGLLRRPRAPGRPRRRDTAAIAAAVPALFLAAVSIIDFLTPADVPLGPLLVAVPALAASVLRMRGIAVFVVLSFAMSVLLAVDDQRLDTLDFFSRLAGLAVVSASSLLIGHIRLRRERELARVRSVAEAVQRSVLRPVPERIGPLRAAAAYVAAEEEAGIGGDLYEVVSTPYGVRMIIGDIQGRGLMAVDAAATLLGAFREGAPREPDLPGLVARLEESMQRYRAQSGPHEEFSERFATAIVTCVPAEPVVQLVSCGHPCPLLLRAGKVHEVRTATPGPPLGLGNLGGSGYHVVTVPFKAGDLLLLYTDGVTEARDATGAFYPLPQRVVAWARADPADLIARILFDLNAYNGGRRDDDAALLAAQRLA